MTLSIQDFIAEAEQVFTTTRKKIDNASVKCGTYSSFLCLETGRYRAFRHRCNKFRECAACMEKRKQDLIARLHDTLLDKKQTKFYEIVQDDETNYRKIRDGLGSDSVIRMPTEDGGAVLWVVATETQVRKYVKNEVILELKATDLTNSRYVTYLASTPEGKRISGGFIKNEEETGVEYVEVARVVYHVGEQQYAIQLAKAAVERTAHLNPDRDSLQLAVNERQYAFEAAAKELGIEIWVLSTHQVTRVAANKINWHQRE